MSVVGYPTPGKEKARWLLHAFCMGAAGSVAQSIPARLLPGAAAFYGVTPATKHLWDQARAEGRDVYYIDNAYFDSTRGEYFRVTRNRLQHTGLGYSDGKRFARLKIPISAWHRSGEHVLICPQSAEFMKVCADYPGDWIADTVAELKRWTKRELRVRPWQRDKANWYRTLPADLENCWALVTYSSASAITALLAGIPAFCTAQDCISEPLAGHYPLAYIGNPPRLEGREAWARILADHQWTAHEMEEGLCWRMLNANQTHDGHSAEDRLVASAC